MIKIFIGPKQKTIENNTYFDKSITLVGNNVDNNVALSKKLPFDYWNPDNNNKEIEFYNKELLKIKGRAQVMAHNPKVFSKCNFPENIKMICKNDENLLEILDDKIRTREMLKSVVPMLGYQNITGKVLKNMNFDDLDKPLVIQLPYGSGGSKTYLYNKLTKKQIKPLILEEEIYSVSEYQEDNIPYNIHCIIGENQIELLSPSEQDLEITDKIEYIGSFFVITLPNKVKEKMIKYSMQTCEKLQQLGYRGVLGIDWIFANDELYFIEINPRFQGSTRQVDLLLKKSNLPSIFELNYMAFYEKNLPSTKKMLFSLYEN